MFDHGYIGERLAGAFDEANTRVLIKWNEDSSAAAKAGALASSRHIVVLAHSALTIGKEALSGAFFTYLSYARDSAARPQDHLDVARAACEAFIARVGSELEERTLRQENFGLPREITMPIVQKSIADLHTALDGFVQDAIRGRHGDQQIVPLASMTWEPTDEHTVVNIAAQRARESAAGFAARVVPLEGVSATAAVGSFWDTPSSLEGVSAAGAVGDLSGAPPLPPGAETVLPPAIARVSVTQDQNVNVTATVTRFALPPEWDPDRREAIRLLTLLPQVLQKADQALRLVEEMRRFGVGGNNPPEDIEALPPAEEIITEATVAGDALLAELTADQPHLSWIHLAARALKRVGGWVATMARWVGRKADAFLDEYLKQLAKPAAYGTVAVISAALVGVTTHLDFDHDAGHWSP